MSNAKAVAGVAVSSLLLYGTVAVVGSKLGVVVVVLAICGLALLVVQALDHEAPHPMERSDGVRTSGANAGSSRAKRSDGVRASRANAGSFDERSESNGVCSSCGTTIAAENDRCDDCTTVGHWRK